ncbi:MAG: hypothetical protein JKY20_03200, partial [Alphaproteobacteria bacterium]|nr:hypothetical protein [Alphaproteobacteria bacterium]
YYNGAQYARLAVGPDGSVLRSNGAAVPSWQSQSVVPLQRLSGAAASYDFTAGFSGVYRSLELRGWMRPVTDDVELWFRSSTDGGANFDSGASDYRYAMTGLAEGNSISRSDAADAKIVLSGGASATFAVSSASGEAAQVHANLEFSGVAHKQIIEFKSAFVATLGNASYQVGSGYRNAAAAINAIQLLFESGNVSDGDVTLYGVLSI